jgi:hypothetical protein
MSLRLRRTQSVIKHFYLSKIMDDLFSANTATKVASRQFSFDLSAARRSLVA